MPKQPKQPSDASSAYGRVVNKIEKEFEALDADEQIRLMFILSNNLRGELVKHLRQGVVRGGA